MSSWAKGSDEIAASPETGEAKEARLRGNLREMGRLLIAFSGGVDSSYLLRVAHEELGADVLALTTSSPTAPQGDEDLARRLATAWEVEHLVVDANELEIPGYAANPTNRCYFCKSSLYRICRAEADRRGITWIADGVNLDDLGDYRPGLMAAQEREIRHPLVEAGLSKAEIRELSRRLGLETADKPSSPCLSSRFPYGTTITPERLTMVAKAEAVLHEHGFAECRVRFHDSIARIEVPVGQIELLMSEPLRSAVWEGVRAAGFAHVTVDLAGFRSGSLNEAIGRSAASTPPSAGRPAS